MRYSPRFPRIGSILFVLCLTSLASDAAFASRPDKKMQATAAAPATVPVPASDGKANAIENSVVKVFSAVRHPDLYKPWTKSEPREYTGSGVIIEGKRILTNAHVVLYASQVQVQANQAGDKFSATVESISPDIDLAVLKLDDETFFDGRAPIVRANSLPDIKEPVMAYGYPTGGTSLSITKGIVSRIEFAGYHHSTSGLRIQIDAAINPGNSGGPAISGDKMIGLAFSNLSGAQNIGYIIPNEEINLFLADVRDGKYDGKPALYDELQTLENPALRAYLGLGKDVKGEVVHNPYSDEPTYPLKEWDVITKIGDTPIDDQGMIKIGPNLRVKFNYQIQKIAKDGKVPLTIFRSGKFVDVQVPVLTHRPYLISSLLGKYPSYFVFGPLVFSTASVEFTEGFAAKGGLVHVMAVLGSPLITRAGDKPAFPDEGLVVISSPFFPHKLSKGYANPIARVVASVNGKHINNLAHLVETLRDAKDDFVKIEFAGRGLESIILPRKDCVAATEDILTDNGVRAQGSADVMQVWNAKSAK